MQTTITRYSAEEYLERETTAEFRSEYRDGEIIPITGGTPNHNQIAGKFYAALMSALVDQPYLVFISDMRLSIPARNTYTYPDVMVVPTPLVYAEGMTVIVLTSSISLIIGHVLGRKLAARGITAENALQNRQETAYIVLTLIAIPILFFLLIGRLNLSHLIPQMLVLYIGEHLQNLMLGGGWFVLGLLVGMEWPGRRDRRRLQQLLIAIAAIALPLAILLHYSLPVTGLLGEPLVVENVVLQTTPYLVLSFLPRATR